MPGPRQPAAAGGRRAGAAGTDRAGRAGGLKLTGEGGPLGRPTKTVIEGALEGEMDDHLGYARHGPAGRGSGNSRNGHRGKMVLTEAGPVEISVPRDRDASSGPAIVAKRQRRLSGLDDMVISLSTKGFTCGVDRRAPGRGLRPRGLQADHHRDHQPGDEGLADWQSRPLEAVYAVVFTGAIQVKIREGQVASRQVYLALGVTADGERDILGLWAG